MAIDKAKITVELPEGVQKMGEITVQGRQATLKVKGTTPGSKTITAKYDNKGEKSTTLTVNDVPNMGTLTPSKVSVETGSDVTLTLTFDQAPILTDVTFDTPEGTTVKTEKALSDKNVTITYTMNTVGEKTFTATYKGGNKTCKVTGVDPTIKTVAVAPETVDENGEATVTITFDAEV